MQWYAGEDPVDSEDMFDVGTAQRLLIIHATPHHDQMTFRCKVTFWDMREECSSVLNVMRTYFSASLVYRNYYLNNATFSEVA